jgi:hypothetical protein
MLKKVKEHKMAVEILSLFFIVIDFLSNIIILEKGENKK